MGINNMSESSEDTTELSWSDDIEIILKNILFNSHELQRKHKSLYLYYQSTLKWFQLPLIVLASINSVLAVSLANYISQDKTSLVNCIFSLLCACISSIQLFLKVEDRMKTELQAYYNFKLLSIKIGSMLKLERNHREVNGSTFLNDCMNSYKNYLESSLVLSGTIPDKIVEMTDRPLVVRNVLGQIDIVTPR
jgi:hypothetical protein